MEEPTKACTKCTLTKPLTDYGKRAAKRDGRRSQCRACDAAYRVVNQVRESERSRAWNANNPERRRASDRRRYWADPERTRARKRGWYAANAPAVRVRKRAAHDPVKSRERQRRWREQNPNADRKYLEAHRAEAVERTRRYRARKRSALNIKFTTAQLAQRLSMFPGCWVCKVVSWTEVDHVKPLVRGGAHCLSNLRPICRSCNASKQDAWPYVPQRA